ncbi:MAG: hypothetical protein EBX52_10455 [Proteobacteria bacterium]|nr:hypothetical protein [Pseudomonadota bacterium]
MKKFRFLFVLTLAIGATNAQAKKTCDCVWMKDPTVSNYSPTTNLIVWNYTVATWNELTIKDRLPECIQACKQHLSNNKATALEKICSNGMLYPTVGAESSVSYRLGVKAVVNRPLLNANIQESGPYTYSDYVSKKSGSTCAWK